MLGDHSFILTQRGYLRPNKLKKTDTLFTENGCKQTFVRLINKGDLIEILWDNGIVEQYTPNTSVKILKDNGKYMWKRVKNLTHEDNVLYNIGKHNISISKPKVDVISGLDTNSGTFAYMAGCYLGGYNVINFEEVLFRHFGTIESKHIPDWVFTEWDVEVIRHFIAGYLDHASEISEVSGDQFVVVENIGILEKLGLMFACADIMTTIYKKKGDGSYVLLILDKVEQTEKSYVCMYDKQTVKGNLHLIQAFPFTSYLTSGILCSEFN